MRHSKKAMRKRQRAKEYRKVAEKNPITYWKDGKERKLTEAQFQADKRYLARAERLLKNRLGRTLPDPFQNRERLLRRKKEEQAKEIMKEAPEERKPSLVASLRRLGFSGYYGY